MRKTTLIISSLMFAAQAFAAEDLASLRQCRPRAMNGDWVSYQNAVVVNPHTGVCKFTVADGLATGTCDFSTGFVGPFSGSVTINSDCSAEVQMDFAPAPVVSSFHLQLHKDRQSFAGRWDNNFGVLGTTHGIKQ
jgi:hypothetical protein